jgi:hypothetical protein
MMKRFALLGISLYLGALSLVACGDDSETEDDKVEVKAPGVDVKAKSLSAAGSVAEDAPSK